MSTLRPFLASAMAYALPIPSVAPVTTAQSLAALNLERLAPGLRKRLNTYAISESASLPR